MMSLDTASVLIGALVRRSKVGRENSPCAQADWLVERLCDTVRATFASFEPRPAIGLSYINLHHAELGDVVVGYEVEQGEDGGTGPERNETIADCISLWEIWVNGRDVTDCLHPRISSAIEADLIARVRAGKFGHCQIAALEVSHAD